MQVGGVECAPVRAARPHAVAVVAVFDGELAPSGHVGGAANQLLPPRRVLPQATGNSISQLQPSGLWLL